MPTIPSSPWIGSAYRHIRANAGRDVLDFRGDAAAALIRSTTRAQALLVPSIAFLDDLSRWNLVVFLDRVSVKPEAWIQHVERIGPLRWN